jgi:hypothetical protein
MLTPLSAQIRVPRFSHVFTFYACHCLVLLFFGKTTGACRVSQIGTGNKFDNFLVQTKFCRNIVLVSKMELADGLDLLMKHLLHFLVLIREKQTKSALYVVNRSMSHNQRVMGHGERSTRRVYNWT